MGILENFRKIRGYMAYTRKERNLQNEVIEASIEDNNFYEEYSAFVVGLEEKLTQLLEEEGFKMVQFRPNSVREAKYFRAAMDDVIFTSYYDIQQTAAGEYQFELKTLNV